MESALQVAMELQVIPVDVCMLMGEIGVEETRWSTKPCPCQDPLCDLAKYFESLATDVRSGRLSKVDLTNHKRGAADGISDNAKIKEMDMQIAELRALALEADENGDEEAEDEFRMKLRKLKKKKKELQSKIREQASGGGIGEANSENEAKISAEKADS